MANTSVRINHPGSVWTNNRSVITTGKNLPVYGMWQFLINKKDRIVVSTEFHEYARFATWVSNTFDMKDWGVDIRRIFPSRYEVRGRALVPVFDKDSLILPATPAYDELHRMLTQVGTEFDVDKALSTWRTIQQDGSFVIPERMWITLGKAIATVDNHHHGRPLETPAAVVEEAEVSLFLKPTTTRQGSAFPQAKPSPPQPGTIGGVYPTPQQPFMQGYQGGPQGDIFGFGTRQMQARYPSRFVVSGFEPILNKAGYLASRERPEMQQLAAAIAEASGYSGEKTSSKEIFELYFQLQEKFLLADQQIQPWDWHNLRDRVESMVRMHRSNNQKLDAVMRAAAQLETVVVQINGFLHNLEPANATALAELSLHVQHVERRLASYITNDIPSFQAHIDRRIKAMDDSNNTLSELLRHQASELRKELQQAPAPAVDMSVVDALKEQMQALLLRDEAREHELEKLREELRHAKINTMAVFNMRMGNLPMPEKDMLALQDSIRGARMKDGLAEVVKEAIAKSAAVPPAEKEVTHPVALKRATVVGLLNRQAAEIKERYGDRLNLNFVASSHKTKRLRAIAGEGKVFVMVAFISHSVTDALRQEKADVCLINGAVSELAAKLDEYLAA